MPIWLSWVTCVQLAQNYFWVCLWKRSCRLAWELVERVGKINSQYRQAPANQLRTKTEQKRGDMRFYFLLELWLPFSSILVTRTPRSLAFGFLNLYQIFSRFWSFCFWLRRTNHVLRSYVTYVTYRPGLNYFSSSQSCRWHVLKHLGFQTCVIQ